MKDASPLLFMLLQYRLPRPDLRDHVRAYYLFETAGPAAQPMCAELANVRFLVSGGGELRLPNGAATPFTSASLLGPTLGAYSISAVAGTRVFGAGVLPRGWTAFFGVAAEDLADRHTDLAAIAGNLAPAALERIRNAESFAEMAAAADEFFSILLNRRTSKLRSAYPSVLEQWLLDSPDRPLDDLIERLDLSRRQTDRLAKQFFGASPKLLQRKHRALNAADRLLDGRASGWMAAAGDGYYDQSHFIKEFRTFIGASPKEYLAGHARLVAAIKTQRRTEIASHPLARF